MRLGWRGVGMDLRGFFGGEEGSGKEEEEKTQKVMFYRFFSLALLSSNFLDKSNGFQYLFPLFSSPFFSYLLFVEWMYVCMYGCR